MFNRRYPSLQRALQSSSSSPRSNLIKSALSSLDEATYNAYNGNQEQVNAGIIKAASSILKLPLAVSLSGDDVCDAIQVKQAAVAEAAEPEPVLPTLHDYGGDDDYGGDYYGGDDDERTTASPQSMAPTTPEKASEAKAPPSTTKRSNLTNRLSLLDISSASSPSREVVFCTQPPDADASPMSTLSVVDVSNAKSDDERIISTVLHLRLCHTKSSTPMSIDHLKQHFPSLLPHVNNLLPDVDDSTFATRERLADCDNELAEAQFLKYDRPNFYEDCFQHKLRGKSFEEERRLFRMLKLLVETGEPEVIAALDEKDGCALLDQQKKLFACPHCGLLFTRNNIIKHSQCLSLVAKLPIQECLSSKLRHYAKLLESSKDLPSKEHRDAIAALGMKVRSLKDGEKRKLRLKFSYFVRFEKALSNTKIELPNDKALIYQQG